MTTEEQWDADWGELMKRSDFRRVLFQIIDAPNMCSAHSDAPEANGSAKDQWIGARRVGLSLTAAAQRIAPKLWMQGLAERMNERRMQELQAATKEKPEDA